MADNRKNHNNLEQANDGVPTLNLQPNRIKTFARKTRNCPLSGEDAPKIDYKDVNLLSQFISERGKMLPRRITSISAKKQRELAIAIKRARTIALLPYVKK